MRSHQVSGDKPGPKSAVHSGVQDIGVVLREVVDEEELTVLFYEVDGVLGPFEHVEAA